MFKTMLNQSVTVKFDFVYFLFEIILSVTALKVETGNENMWSTKNSLILKIRVFGTKIKLSHREKYILTDFNIKNAQFSKLQIFKLWHFKKCAF